VTLKKNEDLKRIIDLINQTSQNLLLKQNLIILEEMLDQLKLKKLKSLIIINQNSNLIKLMLKRIRNLIRRKNWKWNFLDLKLL
jgi:hypothetical protein